MKFVTRFLLSVLTLLVISAYVPGIEVSSLYHALIAAALLGVLNAIVRPVLFVLTLPITIITLGLFSFVINAGLFLFAASFLDGFVVDGFVPALLGSLILSVASTIGARVIK